MFNSGRIEQIGTGRDLYEAPATHFVAGFIGNSNFLPGKVTKVAGNRIEAALPDGTLVQDLPAQGLKIGDQVSIMVRPDRLTIARMGDAALPIRVPATIIDTTFLGDVIHVLTRTSWGEDVSVRLPCDAFAGDFPRVSEPVELGWPGLSSRLYARA